jgi:hypothetical protein
MIFCVGNVITQKYTYLNYFHISATETIKITSGKEVGFPEFKSHYVRFQRHSPSSECD